MGKIKKIFGTKSIKRDFAVYLLCYVLGALIISVACSALLQFAQSKVPKKYLFEYVEDGTVHQMTKENIGEEWEESADSINPGGAEDEGADRESSGKTEGGGAEQESFGGGLREELFVDENGNSFYLHYYAPETIFFSFEGLNGILYEILGIGSGLVFPVVFVVGIGIVSRLFYRRKLQEPLEILNRAADNIANNDLDFEISYEKQDELGKLCSSFEKMRRTLQDNNREMWRQVEERKRLNAAFSHDLRTPLTVLRGQSEMLCKYTPEMSEEKIAETAEMMMRHIARLENYVNTMRDLQRLEDIEVKREQVEAAELIKQMQETGIPIVGEYNLSLNWDVHISEDDHPGAHVTDKTSLRSEKRVDDVQNAGRKRNIKWELDILIVMQVYENLIANAAHYARNTITVSAFGDEDFLYLTVTDDGEGFSAKDLSEAAKPFYRAEKETEGEHFGMGLNICKVLCEKHGGYLQLRNEGGASVTAAFGIQ